MMALWKACLSKDSTLKALQVDLGGELYRQFKPSQAMSTYLGPEIAKWLADFDLSGTS